MTFGTAQPLAPSPSPSPSPSAPPPQPDPVLGRKRISLRQRVTALTAISVGLAVALVSIAGFISVRSSLYDEQDSNLVQRAESLRTTLANIQLSQVPGALCAAGDIRFAFINAASGDAIVCGELAIGDREWAVARGQSSQALRTDKSRDLRMATVPAGTSGGIVVAQSLESTRSTLSRLGLVFLLVGGAGVLLAALAGGAVARAGLRPVKRLTQATERVARTGDLEPIPVSGDDELARLSHSFNSMLAAVAEAQDRQRRLVADAGHELRTPLTSLRTNIELLAASDRPGSKSLSEQDRFELHDDVRAQIEELSTLVGDLVELARDDTPHEIREQLELVDIVEQAMERAARRSSDVTFEARLSPWTIVGEPGPLERAVLNLLDNAVKWSPPGAVVNVTLNPVGPGRAVLQVADQGPGIAESDLPHVFERFYRASTARTLPGSGLGLSIVAAVALRHGGRVWAGRSPSGGALLTVELPGHPSPPSP